ncbi:MAG: 1,5-anhydro-D-fructose reductase [Planctomycetes bacterium ADurb.Bin126]|nr:MAG: 1,5-anhydro-D-fructose reductase [Planctomycetes bacterium ADurb.Bin126]HOD84512.1 Gfo/Idh/MocA family oxidoreductase [Phycisphaerae bacterium]HQL75524.1 Gfo/Idh/MocA family oxidoreductase [Phycisphaerae bacterium]
MRERITRRSLLRRSAAVAAPMIVPAWVLGRAGTAAPAPSNRIRLGLVGLGSMGLRHVKGFLEESDCDLAALCDVDATRLKEAAEVIEKARGQGSTRTFADYRELYACPDLDAVCLAVPDHWHSVVAVQAARAGLAIYGEKPLALTIAEGRAMVREVERCNVVWQTGSWQRSTWHFRHACELVRNGRIGKLQKVEVGIGPGYRIEPQPVMPVPPGFDYETWLGPAPWAPYTEKRCHWNFRWILDYSGGQVTDWGAHHIDIAQWGMNADSTGPVAVEGSGDYPSDGLWDAAVTFRFRCEYANGVVMDVYDDKADHVRFIGTDGWVRVSRGDLKTSPVALIRERFGANEVRLSGPSSQNRQGHRREFLDAVRVHGTTICPIEVGHRSATVCHLGNIAMRIGRKIRWDPQAERVIGDDTAQRMTARAMRGTWTV